MADDRPAKHSSKNDANDANDSGERRHVAGWFDIRNVIGALLVIYGVVLLAMGIFDNTDSQLARADGVNANLWTGLGTLAVGLFFMAWARLRPIVVDDAELEEDRKAAEREPH
jgi:hypothetical protein